MEEQKISSRHRAILKAIVESYIATGEAVASQSVAQVQGLSSATIRNAMADLAAAGLLEQPHTSAGRIPTAQAFRMYVEQLRGGLAVPATRAEIDGSFAGVSSTQEFLQRTSHVLALLSSGVGVALSGGAEMDVLEHIHFSRLTSARVLAVVVMKSGLVRDRVLALEQDLTLSELETAAHFLNENFRGWSIERVRAEITRRMEQERSEYQRMLASVEQLWQKTITLDAAAKTVYVEGVANLIGSGPGTEADRGRLRELMAALAEKQRVVDLLNAYVDARQESVRVVFDLEEHSPELRNLVLIAAPARLAGENCGAVAVLGPKRMQYERTMDAVGYIAQLFERMVHPPQ